MNIFDRAELNEHLKCYSVEFVPEAGDFEAENGSRRFHYGQFSRGMKTKGKEGEVSKWKIRDGLLINFGHTGDASVGYLEHEEWAHDFADEENL